MAAAASNHRSEEPELSQVASGNLQVLGESLGAEEKDLLEASPSFKRTALLSSKDQVSTPTASYCLYLYGSKVPLGEYIKASV
ncbi:hypothetical protein GOP47_0022947 [Adiantum capillus-veneris]|uniref:Uncharacterized protein n=1 Tax=Adiantum capillus-veneris TaxID=13818 RepID=A0A9D4Z4S6_ADICA|nr:hypothetical protein GOP47_0022947 [Adiantum capillus-veneris]